MNKLLGATLVASTLALGAGTACAADVIREARAVDARVTRVKLDGVVDLVLRQGAKPALVISGEREDVARVTTRQHGETLEIDTEKRSNDRRGSKEPKLRAELTVPNLAEFVSEGVGASTVSGFGGERIVLALDGAGTVTLNGNYRNVDARLGGVGSMTIDAGRAERMDLALRGAGQGRAAPGSMLPASWPWRARRRRCAPRWRAWATSTPRSCAPTSSTST